MLAHLRATAWLFVLTLLLCCVAYPLLLWLVGQGLFPHQANGSLVTDADGAVRGSALLAQPFSEPKYFQPRPSAVGYNAAASGGSNLAASNPKLRGRVAWKLGLIARYRADGPRQGAAVGPDVEKWFALKAARGGNPTAAWAEANPTLAGEWVNNSALLQDYVKQWAKDHPAVVAGWKKANPGGGNDPSAVDLAGGFFGSFSQAYPGAFPGEAEDAETKKKLIRPVTAGDEIRQVFFDSWLAEGHDRIDPLRDLEQVPADLVMASGSGLDPHITLRGARYQLDGVVRARAQESGRGESDVRERIEQLLARHSFKPLLGLVGEPLVNVLEVNRAMDAELKK
jgi:K+-transporting ATPase ATPase C chain